MKQPNKRFLPKPCRCCGTEFQPDAPSNLYCSEPCRVNGNRHAYYMRTYGLPFKEYQAKLKAQDGKCALCLSAGFLMSETHRALLMVDHCHDKGTVRGLLCHNCNRALGLLQDDPEVLRRAAAYIEEYREGATTIPEGSTHEAIACGSAEPLIIEGDDIVWTRRQRRAALEGRAEA